MATGIPKTWASNDAITSTVANAELATQWTAIYSPPRARLFDTNIVTIATQSAGSVFTTAGAGNLVTFSDFEAASYTGAMISGTAPNYDGLIAPIDGVYEVSAQFSWDPNTAGQRGAILKQGSTLIDIDIQNPSPTVDDIFGPSGLVGGTSVQVSTEVKALAGAKFQIFGTQSSGGSLDTAGSFGYLEIAWIGNYVP